MGRDYPRFYLRAIRTLAPDVRLVFVWEGGTYIDVAREGHEPTEVINVWDYDKNEPSIPVTKAAGRRHIDDWIEEYPHRQLIKEVRENW